MNEPLLYRFRINFVQKMSSHSAIEIGTIAINYRSKPMNEPISYRFGNHVCAENAFTSI
ncbi:MAG: hypothetical protein FD143_2959 [Ignavibacteria bacterium]|nr:MAG: hypothetical protein FD143_2959 [Ignavibacteria bacterium]